MFDFDIYEEFPIIGLSREIFEPKPYELIGILKITECKLNDLSKQIDAIPYYACTRTDYYTGSFIINEIKSAYEDLKNRFYPNPDELDIDGSKRCIMDEFSSLAEAIRKFRDEVENIWVNICCYNTSLKNEEDSKKTEEASEVSSDEYIDDLSKPFDFKYTYSKLPICKYASILMDDENEWDYDKTIKIINESVEMAKNLYDRLFYRHTNVLLTTGEFFAAYDTYRRLKESVDIITEISTKMIFAQEDTNSRTKDFHHTISKIVKVMARLNTIIFTIDIDPAKIEALK